MSRHNAKNSANRNQSLAVVLSNPHIKPRTLISANAWMSAEHHKRHAQAFANAFGQPITIVTKRGRRLAYAEPE
jgi:hypothetical protein